jgi:4'-phosphopantetheinyl transferase
MSGEWLRVENVPPLEDGVQVWRLEVISEYALFQARLGILSSEEKARAGRLREGRVREQFVSGRWFLRTLLSEVLGTSPQEVAVETGVHGKLYTPAVAGQSVSFSVAHSGETILIALRQRGSVGVDVECHHAVVDVMEVAEEAFHPNEVKRLAAYTNDDLRRRAFYRCWTRKEAVAKADGRGMGLSFSSFEVPTETTEYAAVSVSSADAREEHVYFLHDLSMGEAISASVAVEASDCPISAMMFAVKGR